MNSSRDRILNRIGPASGGSLPSIQPDTTFDATDLWSEFEQHLGALGGSVISITEVHQYIRESAFIEPKAAQILQVSPQANDLWDAGIGISSGEFAIAETGSVVVTAGNGAFRGSSLVPPVNILLVQRERIVGTLKEAIPMIPATSSAIITGPSRTADIEGVLVRGVHGPGTLMVAIYG